MNQALARFLEQPTAAHFRAAWRSTRKNARRVDFPRLFALLRRGEHEQVREELAALPKWLRLSPRVHELAAQAAEAAADGNDAEIERFLFGVCSQGVLAAADGSPTAPYLAIQPEDEAVVLALLGREPLSQALVERKGRRLDVVLCRDGGEVCFDVTHLFQFPLLQRAPRRPLRRVSSVS